MIFQELNYIPEMTVEENLFVGRLPKNIIGGVDWKTVRNQTLELLKRERLPYSPQQKIKNLSVSDIQMLEILKAISYDSNIIIMDEPTSAITHTEVEKLFEKIHELKSRGKSIIYISHKMDEIFRIADEITILRDGQVVDTKPREELDIEKVISLMVGRKLESTYPKESITLGDVMLEVNKLSSKRLYKNISFNVRAGEIVGFAGLMGAGRTEVMCSVFGLDSHDSGSIKIQGKEIKISSVKDSIAHKLVMLSEDRKRYGIIPIRSVRENVSIASLSQFFKGARLHSKLEDEAVGKVCASMNVKTPSLNTVVEALSGGNQQKVVLAKWMLSDPDVLILDEPTRGIDVGAKFEIYKLMMDLVRMGKAIVMVSSELPELIGMCDRIYVMANGAVTGELQREEFSQEKIMRLATGVESKRVGHE
jgi:inositol transport system ATP-binding protein